MAWLFSPCCSTNENDAAVSGQVIVSGKSRGDAGVGFESTPRTPYTKETEKPVPTVPEYREKEQTKANAAAAKPVREALPKKASAPKARVKPAPAPASAPGVRVNTKGPGRPQLVTMRIERPASGSLGVDVVRENGMLLIAGVTDGDNSGPFSKWNQAHPEEAVGHFDRIIEVNGLTDDVDQLYDALTTSRSLRLTIRKMQTFDITLEKKHHNDKLGMEIVHGESRSVTIRRVEPGLLKDWNQAMPLSAVVAGDRILASNRVSGDSDEIVENMKASSKLCLWIGRQSLD